MLATGLIRPSINSYSPLMLLVKKKDGSWHMYIDYKVIYKITIKDRFLILAIDELLDKLHKATFFIKLDLRLGYHQSCVHDTNITKIVFHTHDGHYEFLVMPFGLTNAPVTFQNLMNEVFQP